MGPHVLLILLPYVFKVCYNQWPGEASPILPWSWQTGSQRGPLSDRVIDDPEQLEGPPSPHHKVGTCDDNRRHHGRSDLHRY